MRIEADESRASSPEDLPQSAGDWNRTISDAVTGDNPVLSNLQITRGHYLLSVALRSAIGTDSGANFHSWAVWGSRKAGVTIRQEDRDQASRDATVVAGPAGLLTGLMAGWMLSDPTGVLLLHRKSR